VPAPAALGLIGLGVALLARHGWRLLRISLAERMRFWESEGRLVVAEGNHPTGKYKIISGVANAPCTLRDKNKKLIEIQLK
jgi:hypothetical protein